VASQSVVDLEFVYWKWYPQRSACWVL